MLSIRKQDVPEYLHASPLLENAFQEGENDADLTIEIPCDCLKPDTSVHSENDLLFLLRTVRFWLVPEHIESSHEVFYFAMGNAEVLPNLLPEFGQDFPFLTKLNDTVQPCFEYAMMGNAAKFGLIHFVKYLRGKGYSWDTGIPHEKFTAVAAKYGQCDCLRYALDNGCIMQGVECAWAARAGHVDCLKLACEHGCRAKLELLLVIIEHGHLACAKYLVEVAVASTLAPSTTFCDTAAKFGQLEVLTYLYGRSFPSGISSMNCAAANDHVRCLQFLHESGCALATETLYVAVRCDSLACVTYLHTQGCPWDTNSLQLTTPYGGINPRSGLAMAYPIHTDPHKMISCLIYAAEHGCPITPGTFMLAISYDSMDFLKYLCDRAAPWSPLVPMAAASDGRVQCLEFLLDRGCPCDARAYVNAVWGPHLAVVKCLQARGIEWDETVTRAAVVANQLDTLQYLLQHGCPATAELCVTAAETNMVDCLKCLHENGVPWTETVLEAACGHKNFGCYKYALEHGCPYSSFTSIDAVSTGIAEYLRCLHNQGVTFTQEVVLAAVQQRHLSCLQFALDQGPVECDARVCATAAALPYSHYLECLHEHGIVWDVSTCLAAIRANSFVCLKYAVENGCPMDASLPAEAALHGRHLVVAYLYERGCPMAAVSTTVAALQCHSTL